MATRSVCQDASESDFCWGEPEFYLEHSVAISDPKISCLLHLKRPHCFPINTLGPASGSLSPALPGVRTCRLILRRLLHPGAGAVGRGRLPRGERCPLSFYLKTRSKSLWPPGSLASSGYQGTKGSVLGFSQ